MHHTPSGLYYFDNAVDDELYAEAMEHLKNSPEWTGVGKGKNSRRVIHYGYKYNYGGGSGAATTAFPDWVDTLRQYLIATLDQMVRAGTIPPYNEAFDQCIINKYEPGQGIGKHIDHFDFGAIIGCFTLSDTQGTLSPGEMEFIRDDVLPYAVQTKSQSLYIMTGESRTLWQHQMIGRKSDNIDGKKVNRATRISVTFRSVKK